MSIQIIEHNQISGQLVSEWRQLWGRSVCPHIFNSPEWFLSLLEAGIVKNFSLVVALDSNQIVAVLPVLREKVFGIKTLTCPGGGHLNKLPLLVLENDPEIFCALMGFLKKTGDFYLPETGFETVGFFKVTGADFFALEASASPFLFLGKNPYSYFSKKREAQVLRKARKYKEHLSLKTYKDDNLKGLEIAFVLDEDSAKRENGLATFGGGKEKEFYRELARRFGGQLTVDVLFFDGEPAIFSINFAYGGVYHFYKTSYKKKFNFLAPGKMLLYYRCPSLYREDFSIFDFSRGVSRFKREFTPLSYKQYNVFYAKNIFVRWWWILASRAKRAKDKLYENETYHKIYLARKSFAVKVKNYFDGRKNNFVVKNEKP